MLAERSNESGFTLIELMIVVVIIGILAALAIPRFSQSAVRAKQGEAKLVLKQLCTNQMLYRAESPSNDYFASAATANAAAPNAFATIDVSIAPNARYDYTITTAGQSFVATARADLDGDGFVDTWTIDDQGLLLNPQDDATN